MPYSDDLTQTVQAILSSIEEVTGSRKINDKLNAAIKNKSPQKDSFLASTLAKLIEDEFLTSNMSSMNAMKQAIFANIQSAGLNIDTIHIGDDDLTAPTTVISKQDTEYEASFIDGMRNLVNLLQTYSADCVSTGE